MTVRRDPLALALSHRLSSPGFSPDSSQRPPNHGSQVRFLLCAALITCCAPCTPLALAAEPALVEISTDQQRAFGVELASPTLAEDTLTRRYPAQVAVPNPQLRVVSTPQAGVIEALLVGADGDQRGLRGQRKRRATGDQRRAEQWPDLIALAGRMLVGRTLTGRAMREHQGKRIAADCHSGTTPRA
jgi:hypothetical protein